MKNKLKTVIEQFDEEKIDEVFIYFKDGGRYKIVRSADGYWMVDT